MLDYRWIIGTFRLRTLAEKYAKTRIRSAK
jgi:hypothetical protein